MPEWKIYLLTTIAGQLGWALDELRKIASKMCSTRRLVDVGCYDGKRTHGFCKVAGFKRVVMIDMHPVQIHMDAAKYEFHQFDMEDPNFAQTFRKPVPTIITCFQTLHESWCPETAVQGLFNAVEPGSAVVIWDLNQSGWQLISEIIESCPPADREHFENDLVRLEQTGLADQQKIRSFWENMARRFPGNLTFTSLEHSYLVVYVAK